MDDEVSGLIASPGTYAQSPLFLHGPSPVLRIPTTTIQHSADLPRQPDSPCLHASHRGDANSRTCSALIISTASQAFVNATLLDRSINRRSEIVSIYISFPLRLLSIVTFGRDACKKFTRRIMGNATRLVKINLGYFNHTKLHPLGTG